MAGLEAIFTFKSYMETIRPDEAQFLGLHACEFLLSNESVLIG